MLLIELPSKNTKKLVTGKCFGPTFSPDGKQIAFSLNNSIHVIDVAGGTPVNTGIESKQDGCGYGGAYNSCHYWLKLDNEMGKGEYFYWYHYTLDRSSDAMGDDADSWMVIVPGSIAKGATGWQPYSFVIPPLIRQTSTVSDKCLIRVGVYGNEDQIFDLSDNTFRIVAPTSVQAMRVVTRQHPHLTLANNFLSIYAPADAAITNVRLFSLDGREVRLTPVTNSGSAKTPLVQFKVQQTLGSGATLLVHYTAGSRQHAQLIWQTKE